MMIAPYRVKRVRLVNSVLVDNERENIHEADDRIVLWRVSEHEFRAKKMYGDNHVRPHGLTDSEWADRNRVIGFFSHQVRQVQLYQPGEPMPFPEQTSPPEIVDGPVASKSKR